MVLKVIHISVTAFNDRSVQVLMSFDGMTTRSALSNLRIGDLYLLWGLCFSNSTSCTSLIVKIALLLSLFGAR